MGSDSLTLYPWQEKAVNELASGKVLYGEVGSGKTFTALVFYKKNYGHLPLYVITTAKKRDTGDWEKEAGVVGITELTVDSWNNIKEYVDISNAFFIFDEQRAVGYGTWSLSMIKIAWNSNKWVMLTGTPGDRWIDYMTLFIANGWYKNKTDFINQHVEYDRFAKYPRVKAYHNQAKLQNYRKSILVGMHMVRKTERERIDIVAGYNKEKYMWAKNLKRNPDTGKPFKGAGEYTQFARKLVSTSKGRVEQLERLLAFIERPIVFYNYDYERDILLQSITKLGLTYAEWSGHKHQSVPTGEHWVYIVQYTAGAEGWNCTTTDSMIFYSPNYSYKMMEQAEGRIDRLNTSYTHLKYYFLQSESPIDHSVFNAIKKKKKFNESAWAKGVMRFAGTGLSEGSNSKNTLFAPTFSDT